MHRLRSVIQYYKWGRRDFIPSLLRIEAEPDREYAELWMGAHPNDSSILEIDGNDHALVDLVREQPQEWLGNEVYDQYEAYFPFLLKVLSINTALSIQVHPNSWHAIKGHQREEERGVPADSPLRLYKDTHHKPELLCALTPVWAMCGFRSTKEIEDEFNCPHYQPLRERITGALTIETLFPLLLAVNEKEQTLKRHILQSCAEHIKRLHPQLNATVMEHATPADDVASDRRAYWWVLKLMQQFPDDLCALAPLYLNLFLLQPDEGLYIGTRTPHAYLFGNGVEIMANSDNVLRCGLSQKHIDAQELLRVVDFHNSNYRHIGARKVFNGVGEYLTPAAEFELLSVDSDGGAPIIIEHNTPVPKILLCTDGEVAVYRMDTSDTHERTASSNTLTNNPFLLERGHSLFCVPNDNRIAIKGKGKVYIGIPSTKVQYDTAR